MSSFIPSYHSLPQQSMAPKHQNLMAPPERRFNVPRKPLSTRSWDSQKNAYISEQELSSTYDSDWIDNEKLTAQEQEVHEESLTRLWLVELTSLTIAFVSFGAIVVTLSMHEDRPLPKWPSLISINTLIAIFTAVMKACMLLPIAEGVSQLKWLWFHRPHPLIDLERFDSASRGPWGCVLLIVKRHTSQLAAFGAFITITAMAIEPFAQQVIQYDYCSTLAPEHAASISRTNNYTAGSRAANGGVGHASPVMNAALYGTGLFDPPVNVSSSIHTNCLTGNCTFPATVDGISYMSLGMCSSCTDISHKITNSKDFTTGNDNETSSYTTYSLPSGISVSPIEGHTLADTIVLTPPDQSGQMMITQSMITFEMIMFDPTVCEDVPTLSGCRVWASQCSLTPCAKSYGANITNGILYEQELSAVPLQFLPASAGYAYFGIFVNTTIVNGQVLDCTSTKHPTKQNTLRMAEGITWLSQDYFKNTSLARYYPPECAFVLGMGSTDALAGALFETYNNQTIQNIGLDYSGNPWMMQLFDSGAANPTTLDTAINGLANAITVAIRNEGDKSNSGPAVGTMMISQTCIRVRWAWLVLPTSLLLLTTIFLTATIQQTYTNGTGKAWKSSPLALLFHGFCSKTVQNVGNIGRLDEMNETAEKMQAQLRRDQHGWKFSEVLPEAN